MTEFYENDIVRIGKLTEFYGISKDDPRDTNGKIVHTSFGDNDFRIRVEWDNDGKQSYRPEDLRLVRRG